MPLSPARSAPDRAALRRLHALLAAGLLCWGASVHAAEDPSAEVQRLMRAGQTTQAGERLDKALADNPRDAQLRFLRGVLQSDAGRQAEAIQTFDQLAVDHPELPEPYNNLAVIHAAQGDYERAKGELEAALRARPGYAVAYQNLGDVYLQLSRQAYQQALELDPLNSVIPARLTLLRELAGQPASLSSNRTTP